MTSAYNIYVASVKLRISQNPYIPITFSPGIITLTKLGSSITLEIISVPAYPKPTANKPPILTIRFYKIFGYVCYYFYYCNYCYIDYINIFFYSI